MLSIGCQSDTTSTQENEIESDHNINKNLGIEAGQCKKYIFQSRDEMERSLSKLCYGNFYVIGSIWLEGMKKIMVGKRMCVVPKTNAATNNNKLPINGEVVLKNYRACEADSIPTKPPDMPYTDLPMYSSPHSEYNEYVHGMWYRRGCNCYTLQKKLYPYVRQARIKIQCKAKEGRQQISESLDVVRFMMAKVIYDLQEHMRCPCNRVQAKTCVALCTATGVVLGSRKGLLRAIFYGGLCALASGSLCFPKETDVAFRNACYAAWSTMREGHYRFEKKKIVEKRTCISPNGVPKCPEEESKNSGHKQAKKRENKCPCL